MCMLLNVYVLCRKGQKGSENNVLQRKHRAMFWIKLFFEGTVFGAEVMQWEMPQWGVQGGGWQWLPCHQWELQHMQLLDTKTVVGSMCPPHPPQEWLHFDAWRYTVPLMLYPCYYKHDWFNKKKACLAIWILFNHFKVLHTCNLFQRNLLSALNKYMKFQNIGILLPWLFTRELAASLQHPSHFIMNIT